VLYPQIAGIVDDNEMLAYELESLGYEGKVYLYGKENEKFKGSSCVVVCPAWEDVVRAIKL
jgi:hypothetical protein